MANDEQAQQPQPDLPRRSGGGGNWLLILIVIIIIALIAVFALRSGAPENGEDVLDEGGEAAEVEEPADTPSDADAGADASSDTDTQQ